MAGAITDRELSVPTRTSIRFALAAEADEAAIRQLLRDNPMRGEISLSFEREPNYFLGAGVAGSDDQTMLAFEGERLLCMGRCSIRRRYMNGVVRRVGYLAELRLDASAQGRFDILRDGYRFLRELHRDSPPDVYFTSIAADNYRAIRLFERGLRGLPTYRFLTGFVTLVIPVPRKSSTRVQQKLHSRGLSMEKGAEGNLPELTDFLNAQSSLQQLAAHWTPEDLRSLAERGLTLDKFLLLRKSGKIVACIALWDQRNFRQTVIREYGRTTRIVRPAVNLAAKFLNTPRLPEPNSILAQAFLSPLAIDPGYAALLPDLITLCAPTATQCGVEFLTLGLAANDSRLPMLKKHFNSRVYQSRLYCVAWPDSPATSQDFASTHCLPEVALL